MKRPNYGLSRLSRSVVETLPVKRDKDGKPVLIKFRPQENPSCVNAYGGKACERGGRSVDLPLHHSEVYADTARKGVKQFVKVAEYKREYDNPDKPDTFIDAKGNLQWANGWQYNNFWVVLHYVGILNNPDNRKKAYRVYAANDYAESLREANVCNTCYKPLRTSIAKVAFKENLDVKRDTVIADCKSHFEVRKNPETGKFFFLYVDGTGRRILSRRRYINGIVAGSEFYLADTGEVVTPVSEYRVERLKCGCGLD